MPARYDKFSREELTLLTWCSRTGRTGPRGFEGMCDEKRPPAQLISSIEVSSRLRNSYNHDPP